MVNLYIDATGLILGRLASYVAKQAREGNNVFIFNCEKAVISGAKGYLQKSYKERMGARSPKSIKGPYRYRVPDKFVRRAIRGMIENKRSRGREAFKKVITFIGIPEKYANEKLITVEKADAHKRKTLKIYSVGELCKWLGGKW